MNCEKCNGHLYSRDSFCSDCGTKNPNLIPDMSECKICEKKILGVGLKNHIIGKAKNEFFKGIKDKHYTLV